MVSVVRALDSIPLPCRMSFVPLHRKRTRRRTAHHACAVRTPNWRNVARHRRTCRAPDQQGNASPSPCSLPTARIAALPNRCNARASRMLAYGLPRSLQCGVTSEGHESACLSVLSMVCGMPASGACMGGRDARNDVAVATGDIDADRPHGRCAVRTARMLRVLAPAAAVRDRVGRRRRRSGADRRGSGHGHAVRDAAAFPRGWRGTGRAC